MLSTRVRLDESRSRMRSVHAPSQRWDPNCAVNSKKRTAAKNSTIRQTVAARRPGAWRPLGLRLRRSTRAWLRHQTWLRR